MTEPVEQRSGFDIPEGSAKPGDVDWEKASEYPTAEEPAAPAKAASKTTTKSTTSDS